MKTVTLMIAAVLLLVGCASDDAKQFTKQDTATIGEPVKRAHEEIKKASTVAADIERTGTPARSKEAASLLLNLRTAEADARAAMEALQAFNVRYEDQVKKANAVTVERDIARAETQKAKNELTSTKDGFFDHLMRLRYAVVAAVILGGLAYFLGPSLKSASGAYGALIPNGLAGLAAVIAVVIVVSAILFAGALFGFL